MHPLLQRFVQAIPKLGPRLKRLHEFERSVPLGHYYCAIPSLEEIQRRDRELFARQAPPLPGIDLRDAEQLALLRSLQPFVTEAPWPDCQTNGFRFYYDNKWYGRADALVLFAMVRHLRPQRIIEVGSGHSSGLLLDTRDRFLPTDLELTFVEPNPDRLQPLLGAALPPNTRLLEQPVQSVSVEEFGRLEANDILLIDSSHVSRIGSDVNFLAFEVLPRLRTGVRVHIHDIFWPFEYPRDWVLGGRSWNEAYLVRALLMGSQEFAIDFFSHYLSTEYRDEFASVFKGCPRDSASSLWISKV